MWLGNALKSDMVCDCLCNHNLWGMIADGHRLLVAVGCRGWHHRHVEK